jgi:DNA polymerase III alpha subunit
VSATGRTNGHSRGADAFVHLDVMSAFSRLQSPSTPHDYVSTLVQQFPLNEQSASQPRPAIALCDWGLHAAVKMAVACARAGVEHLPGLRLRVVPEAAWHPWAEQPRELLLLAGDDEAWLSLVALSNTAYLANADFRGPRDDSWVSRLSCINLTTVGQDADRMAALAVDRAIARLNGQAASEREIVLPPYLVVRGTTAAPSERAVPLRRARAR